MNKLLLNVVTSRFIRTLYYNWNESGWMKFNLTLCIIINSVKLIIATYSCLIILGSSVFIFFISVQLYEFVRNLGPVWPFVTSFKVTSQKLPLHVVQGLQHHFLYYRILLSTCLRTCFFCDWTNRFLSPL